MCSSIDGPSHLVLVIDVNDDVDVVWGLIGDLSACIIGLVVVDAALLVIVDLTGDEDS